MMTKCGISEMAPCRASFGQAVIRGCGVDSDRGMPQVVRTSGNGPYRAENPASFED